MFIGSVIFRFFGVLLRWIAINTWFLICKKRRLKFSDVWIGKQKKEFLSNASYEMSNIILGSLFILTVCALLFFFKV